MTATVMVQSEWMSHIEGRPIPDSEHAHYLNTARGPVIFFINTLNRHLVVLKPNRNGGQETVDLSNLWKLPGPVSCLASAQGSDGAVHLFFAKESTQEGLLNKLFAIVPILPPDFDEAAKWKDCLREFTPLSFLSGSATIQSIALSFRKGSQSTATVVFKLNGAWKAINLGFQESNGEGGDKKVDGSEKQDGISGEEQCKSADEMNKPAESKELDNKKQLTSLPKVVGTNIEFANHADPDIVPRILPGKFGDKRGLFYYFSSKGLVKLGFRQNDGISKWLEPPMNAVSSLQIVTGGLLVGTTKCLLLYEAGTSISHEDGKLDGTSVAPDDSGNCRDTSRGDRQDESKIDAKSVALKSSPNPDLINDAQKDREVGGEKDWKGDPKNSEDSIDEKGDKDEMTKPSIVHDGPVSQLRLASTPDRSQPRLWMLFGDDQRTLAYVEWPDAIRSPKAGPSSQTIQSPKAIQTPMNSSEFKLAPVVRGNISSFSPSFSIDGSSEAVLYHNSHGLNLLERSSAGVWSERLFEIPASTIVKMAPAYVSHIKFSSHDYSALHSSRFLLTCTSSATVLVNEAPLLVDDNPQLIGLDAHGKIEIVNLTEELQTPTFTLQNAPGTAILVDPLMLDPAHRVKQRMQEKKSPSDLKELTVGKASKRVFPKATDFEKLSEMLKDMYDEMNSLPPDGTRKQDIPPLEDKDIESWSLFHIVESTIDGIQNFAVQGGHLVITVAGKIIGFVIDCFETALKALGTIFAATGAIVEDLQHWLGYLFDWDDIVTTHTSLAAVFNFALSVPDKIIDDAYDTIDASLLAFLENITAKMDTINEFKHATSDQESLESVTGSDGPNKTQQSGMSHPAIDYLLNKLPTLFLGSSIKIDVDLDSKTLSSFGKFVDSNGDLFAHLESLAQMTFDGKHVSLLQILELFGEAALATLIEALRGMLASLKKILLSIVKALKNVVNKPRSLPLLSALYKFATGSMVDPSFLQITALVIAIPVSITCKVLKGRNFPVFTSDNMASLLGPTATGTTQAIPRPPEIHLASIYESALPHLRIWTGEQARTLGWIDLLHTSLMTIPLVCPDVREFGLRETQPGTPGMVTVNNVTVVRTILQGFGAMASLPMIQPDQWESTAVPKLRLEAWGLDAGLRILEMVTSWQAVEDATAASYNKSLVVVRNTLSVILWSRIAAAEHGNRLPGMSDEEFAKVQAVAMWTVPESLALYASHIAPVMVNQATPENVRGVIALTAFGLGVAGNASRWARSEYHGDGGRTFSGGLI